MFRFPLFLCVLVGLIILLSFGLPNLLFYNSGGKHESKTSSKNSWFIRLSLNLLGYGTIIIPGYCILQYVKKYGIGDQPTSKFFTKILQSCFLGREVKNVENGTNTAATSVERSTTQDALTLILCVSGLQCSYLVWGVIQEKIMTKDYVSPYSGNPERFTDSQFLVFVNRIWAFCLSGCYILVTTQRSHYAPLYKYSYCSFSNVMSSWCQYEALKFVSFPTQVLAKACKIIPVMVMGKVVSRKSYEFYEYATAFAISIGMAMFLFGSAEEHKSTTETTLSGVVILIGYMAFDSFTSNWQSELYCQYKMSPVQMMCGVNLFSCLFTGVSLFQQGVFKDSFYFMLDYPIFVLDIFLLSLCSALGQLFVFYTIAQFGPVVFVIIMTVRQCLAILLSCIIYSHPINAIGILGIVVVFLAIFMRIYCSQRIKALRKMRPPDPANKV